MRAAFLLLPTDSVQKKFVRARWLTKGKDKATASQFKKLSYSSKRLRYCLTISGVTSLG
jgi:hypothetical protein